MEWWHPFEQFTALPERLPFVLYCTAPRGGTLESPVDFPGGEGGEEGARKAMF